MNAIVWVIIGIHETKGSAEYELYSNKLALKRIMKSGEYDKLLEKLDGMMLKDAIGHVKNTAGMDYIAINGGRWREFWFEGD